LSSPRITILIASSAKGQLQERSAVSQFEISAFCCVQA
jgi:hypothetical protein